MTPQDRHRLRALTGVDLPPPAGGRTAARWLTMSSWARSGSVSVARLAEAHHDALGILHEAGLEPGPGIYGVWAAQSASDVLVDLEDLTLSGRKHFCSGLGIVDRALVVAADAEGNPFLVDTTVVPTAHVHHDPTGWQSPALADTATGSICFERHPGDRIVGETGWYLSRPGFWHGAIGPAACWAGAALGLVDIARSATDPTTFEHIALGELAAEEILLAGMLTTAGHSADNQPDDRLIAQRCAYGVRHLVERSASRIADSFSRAFGPRPFVADSSTAQRLADLHLYLRQHHGLRDLAALGALDLP